MAAQLVSAEALAEVARSETEIFWMIKEVFQQPYEQKLKNATEGGEQEEGSKAAAEMDEQREARRAEEEAEVKLKKLIAVISNNKFLLEKILKDKWVCAERRPMTQHLHPLIQKQPKMKTQPHKLELKTR
jgi:hypothetical protein